MSGADLRIAGLTKSFGERPVLRSLDLVVPGGTFLALLGPSGSGKTTLLRLIAGFERPDQGEITVGSTTLDDATTHLRPERRHLGYVAQEGSLFPHLTVRANVAFGLPRRERRSAAVRGLLDLVGLGADGDRYPHQLSGGQQQRVALARALAVHPALVLLDEPFAALDDTLRQSVRHDVREILRTYGATVVLVTHDQDEALSTADLVAVLRDGAVAQLGTPADVYHRPLDPGLASMVGAANVLTGEIAGERFRCALGSLAFSGDARGAAASGLLRPEQLALSSPGEGTPATVVAVRFHGHDAVVTVALADSTALTVRLLGATSARVGDRVGVTATGPVTLFPSTAA